MKKRRKAPQNTEPVIKNPVAKYARQFTKAQVFNDKSKYQRKAKHKGMEPFSINQFIDKGFSAELLLHALMAY